MEKENKTVGISIRCTLRERERIKENAITENKNVSEFLLERGKMKEDIYIQNSEKQKINEFMRDAQEVLNLSKEGNYVEAQRGVRELCKKLRES